MYKPKSDFLKIMLERGFYHQSSNLEGLDEEALQKGLIGYIGFDSTAPSLHVGGLMQIMILRWLQKTGHKPIVLMGGGTTLLGDPSFKDESRPLLSQDKIQENMNGIKRVFNKFIEFGDGKTDAIMLNNADWLTKINYLEFLRDYGIHFTVNRMLSFDSVKLRLEREQPLTFLEFNYMLLQAYDFLELNRRYGVNLQMGGSDQWGNIINGVELNRRVQRKEVFALTSPLLTTASGVKMGKTVGGAIWLEEEMLPTFDYWQYWRNTEDADVGKFLRLYTELPLDEIKKLEELKGSEINEAKKILATEITALLHGKEKANIAMTAAIKTFEEKNSTDNLPTININIKQLETGVTAYELIKLAGFAKSNSEARRLIEQNGVKINDHLFNSFDQIITQDDIVDNTIKLSSGKKKHILIKGI